MKRFALAALLALAGCGQPPAPMSEWERSREERLPPPEESIVLPPYPAKPELLGFSAAPTSSFRFFVDAGTLTVGKDGVVRYVLFARSDTGVENVSYEGMRCATGEVRLYAVGRDGRWSGRTGEWREIAPRSVQRWHNELYRNYFCPGKQIIHTAEEGVDALRNGGHPSR